VLTITETLTKLLESGEDEEEETMEEVAQQLLEERRRAFSLTSLNPRPQLLQRRQSATEQFRQVTTSPIRSPAQLKYWLKVSFHIQGIGVSIIDETPKELLYGFFEDVKIEYAQSWEQTYSHIRIRAFEVIEFFVSFFLSSLIYFVN
jgi:hypothetical protein